MPLYSDPVPPVLSTPLAPSISPNRCLPPSPQDQSTTPVLQTAIEPIKSPSALVASEHSHFENGYYRHELGSDIGHSSTPGSSPPTQKQKQSNRSQGANLMRRWSLLEIPDEVLAVEFEEVRRVTKLKERRRSFKAKSENHMLHSSSLLEEKTYTPGAFVYGGPTCGQKFWLGCDDEDASDDDRKSKRSEGDWECVEDDDPGINGNEEQEERGWKRTRRALFCCRELIRTEKNYFTRLVQLLDGKVYFSMFENKL
jgi:hypothetical protein